VITLYHNENVSERLDGLPPIDLIVFDSNLVGFDGERFAEGYYVQIKAHPNTRHVPLILLAHENEKDRLGKLQADVHLVKPIDPDKFNKILRGYLAAQR
jgi:CheY-like chemotaxis protein